MNNDTHDSPQNAPHPANEMDLFGHLRELRSRLIRALLGIAVGAIVAYQVSDFTFELLAAPFLDAFDDKLLIGTGPAEAFLLKLKVAFFGGCVLSMPWLLLQVWLFVAPGLHEHEKKLVVPFILVSSLLFAGGLSFCYSIVLPFAFNFFHSQYASIGVEPTIRISEHLSMMIKSLLGFGAVFEMPVVAFFFARLGLLDDTTLIRYFRHATVIIFIIAAVLTPPDVITQILMAAPLLILYGVSILVVKYAQPKELTEEAEEPLPPAETNS